MKPQINHNKIFEREEKKYRTACKTARYLSLQQMYLNKTEK